MTSKELQLSTTYLTELKRAIRASHPMLSEEEVQIIAVSLMRKITEHLRQGETPAFVKWRADGSIVLTVFSINEISKELRNLPGPKEK